MFQKLLKAISKSYICIQNKKMTFFSIICTKLKRKKIPTLIHFLILIILILIVSFSSPKTTEIYLAIKRIIFYNYESFFLFNINSIFHKFSRYCQKLKPICAYSYLNT